MTIYHITYDDLSADMREEIFLEAKAEELDKLRSEGNIELLRHGDNYREYFSKNKVDDEDQWLVSIAQLYDFDVPDAWDRTSYLFYAEEFAEDKARERIDKNFHRLEVVI